MRRFNLLPNGLAVMSDLYLGHVIYVVMIGSALFAAGYLLHP